MAISYSIGEIEACELPKVLASEGVVSTRSLFGSGVTQGSKHLSPYLDLCIPIAIAFMPVCSSEPACVLWKDIPLVGCVLTFRAEPKVSFSVIEAISIAMIHHLALPSRHDLAMHQNYLAFPCSDAFATCRIDRTARANRGAPVPLGQNLVFVRINQCDVPFCELNDSIRRTQWLGFVSFGNGDKPVMMTSDKSPGLSFNVSVLRVILFGYPGFLAAPTLTKPKGDFGDRIGRRLNHGIPLTRKFWHRISPRKRFVRVQPHPRIIPFQPCGQQDNQLGTQRGALSWFAVRFH